MDELAPLDVIGSKPAPTQQSIKVRVFAGLRAAGFDVAGLEAAYAAWWEGAGDAKGLSDGIAEAWEEATKKETWAYVSAFLHAAAGPMLATHLRNLDKDCIGVAELEYAPITTDYVESGSPTSTSRRGRCARRASTRASASPTLTSSVPFTPTGPGGRPPGPL